MGQFSFLIDTKIKVLLSYDLNCVIFSSFNFMVIFNIASADIAESQKMNLKLKELKIAQLGS